MKYLLVFILFLSSCWGGNSDEIDIYFNSAQAIFTKRFKIKITDATDNLFEGVVDQTTVDTYKKIGRIKIKPNISYRIVVNDIDTTIRIKKEFNKIFLGYKDYLIPTENSTSTRDSIRIGENTHKIILSFGN